MDPTGELAQLLQRLRQLAARRGHKPLRVGRIVADPTFDEGELQRGVTSRCWAPSCRLRSIRRRSASAAEMPVPVTPAPRRAGFGLRKQLLVLQRDGGRAAHRLNQLWVFVEGPVVDQCGDQLTIAFDRRHRPVVVRGQATDRSSASTKALLPGTG